MPLKSVFPDPPVQISDNLSDFILRGPVSKDPDAVCLIDSGTSQKWTLRQLQKESSDLAKGLYDSGLKTGDIMGVYLPNCGRYVSILLAVFSRGAVVCGINPAYTEEEVKYSLVTAECKYVFANSANVGTVRNAVRNGGLNTKIVIIDDGATQSDTMETTYDNLLAKGQKVSQVPSVKVSLKVDTALLLFSSGTSGRPKAVMLSSNNMMISMENNVNSTLYLAPRKGDHNIAVLPLYHLYGLIMALSCLRIGVVTVTMPKYERKLYLQLTQDYKVPVLFMVPPMLVMLAKDAIVENYDLACLRGIFVGGAPVGIELSEEVFGRFSQLQLLMNGYGLAESGGGALITPFTQKSREKSGSCGTLTPTFESKVVNPETGQECTANQTGEICLRGPTCMLGYFKNQKATSEMFDEQGWLHTGDLGYYDDDGYFYIIDRLKELIKVKGFQVPPAELEDLLLSHPDIQDAAVIGIPDLRTGEIPKAFVVKRPGSKVAEAEIANYVAERVSQFKHLKGGVEFTDAIPKSAAGKILRRILKEREEEKKGKRTSKM